MGGAVPFFPSPQYYIIMKIGFMLKTLMKIKCKFFRKFLLDSASELCLPAIYHFWHLTGNVGYRIRESMHAYHMHASRQKKCHACIPGKIAAFQHIAFGNAAPNEKPPDGLKKGGHHFSINWVSWDLHPPRDPQG